MVRASPLEDKTRGSTIPVQRWRELSDAGADASLQADSGPFVLAWGQALLMEGWTFLSFSVPKARPRQRRAHSQAPRLGFQTQAPLGAPHPAWLGDGCAKRSHRNAGAACGMNRKPGFAAALASGPATPKPRTTRVHGASAGRSSLASGHTAGVAVGDRSVPPSCLGHNLPQPEAACSCLPAEAVWVRGQVSPAGGSSLALFSRHWWEAGDAQREPPAQPGSTVRSLPSAVLLPELRVRRVWAAVRCTRETLARRFSPPETPGTESPAFSCPLHLGIIDSC